jgi:hypothetical protein
MYCWLRGAIILAAFAPDKGESVQHPDRRPLSGVPVPLIPRPKDGCLLLDRDKFHGSFAADLPAERAEFMADSQIPRA